MTPDTPACLLAMDTATEVVHLGLWAHGRVFTRALPGGSQASSTTLPAAQDLLAEAGLPWSAISAIAFGQGPGAFTGLRTACALTQGLGLGLSKPVLVLDTLMAVAESARSHAAGLTAALAANPAPASGGSSSLWVLQDARMSEVYAAAYAWQPGPACWRAQGEPQLWPLAHLQAQIEAGVVWHAAGSALAAYPAQVQALRGLAVPHACPEGAALLTLAHQAWQRGELCDAALALPRYVRDKVAQTTAERLHAA